jgi:hypothetical protein
MLSEEDFTGSIACALEMLPMMRQLSTTTLAKMYMQLPSSVVQDLNLMLLEYAIKQRMLDPDPPNKIAFHMQLFRYVYPLENNVAVFDRGLRSDLRDRISNPDIFYDPSPQREEFMTPNHDEFRLPPSAYWHPSKMTPVQWEKHLKTLQVQVSLIDESAIDPAMDGHGILAAQQLAQGMHVYQQALKGFWLLNADAGKVAHNWIARNKNLAQEMLQQAIADRLESIETTTSEGDEVPW